MPELAIECFERWAGKTPDAVAVVSHDGVLTYRQLDHLASTYAAALANLSISRGDTVGVLALPSPEMIAAILAVFKVRAAYVPLDPAYPRSRLRQLVKDSDASAALVDERLAHQLPEGIPIAPLTALDLSTEPDLVHSGPAGTDLAYVIYTSGSTGLPKGVQVSQASLVNLLQETGTIYRLTPDDVAIFTHSFAFDASILEIFGPLTHGASVVIATMEERKDATALVRLIERHGVTIWDLVPAMLTQFVEIPSVAATCASLRIVVSGADTLNRFHPGVDVLVGKGCRSQPG